MKRLFSALRECQKPSSLRAAHTHTHKRYFKLFLFNLGCYWCPREAFGIDNWSWAWPHPCSSTLHIIDLHGSPLFILSPSWMFSICCHAFSSFHFSWFGCEHETKPESSSHQGYGYASGQLCVDLQIEWKPPTSSQGSRIWSRIQWVHPWGHEPSRSNVRNLYQAS